MKKEPQGWQHNMQLFEAFTKHLYLFVFIVLELLVIWCFYEGERGHLSEGTTCRRSVMVFSLQNGGG